MNGKIIAVIVMLVIIVSNISDAMAQSGKRKAVKPGSSGKAISQSQSIKQQQRGQYPAFSRNSLPLGAINYNWATKCKPNESTVNTLFMPGSEIRIRTRQLIGTVIVFPEVVSSLTSGLGDAITLSGYPSSKSNSSRIWILGTRAAGLDGNLAFIGGVEVGGPRIYSLRVQTEGVNSKNCPDLVVNIKSATDNGLAGIAERIAKAMTSEAPAPSAIPVIPVKSENLGTSEMDEPGGSGRQTIDWLEGFNFDPSKIDFHWAIGDRDEVLGGKLPDFAPDIAFSDDEFLYLKWDDSRMKEMILPAISAVIKTDRGKVDAPVTWVRRGNTIIVQRKANLTLEFEGIVVCISRQGDSVKKES
jgi:hypothetical protein